ncbi:hypothetical protein GGI20_002433 [Coemansia sp. BCRC 34301]|nr:hypothetical protein GGI20_002433 [Coemansia sp. BCRC 34301]
MQPYCLPLTSVKSTDEPIIVLADVMLTHNWMVDEADTLHRDISPSNIMVGRDRAQDGSTSVYSQLIDLDYAINIGNERIPYPERAGTLPFMGVLNLEADPSQRTEHDDWESLLYVLCWMATFGINEADAKKLIALHRARSSPELTIKGWRDGISMEDIAHNKRWYLDAMDAFTDSITDYFSGSHLLGHSTYDIAEHAHWRTLLELYFALFQNADARIGLECRGTSKATEKDASAAENKDLAALFAKLRISYFDPFNMRAKDPAKRIIVASLLKVMKDSAELAKERIKKAAAV